MTPEPSDYAFFRGLLWGVVISAPCWFAVVVLVVLCIP